MPDTETIAGPGGPVALGDIVFVDMVMRPNKTHHCAGCHSAIAHGEHNLAVCAVGGSRWRLCTRCAPQRLDGEEIAWGKKGYWSATRRERYGSGWHPRPATPENAEAVAREEDAEAAEHNLASRLAVAKVHARWDGEVAAARHRAGGLVDTVAALACRAALVDDDESWEVYMAAGRAIAYEVLNVDTDEGRGWCDADLAAKLLVDVCRATINAVRHTPPLGGPPKSADLTQ